MVVRPEEFSQPGIPSQKRDAFPSRSLLTLGDYRIDRWVFHNSLDDMSQFEKRLKMDHHQQIRKDVQEQNLLRRPLTYAKLDELDIFTR